MNGHVNTYERVWIYIYIYVLNMYISSDRDLRSVKLYLLSVFHIRGNQSVLLVIRFSHRKSRKQFKYCFTVLPLFLLFSVRKPSPLHHKILQWGTYYKSFLLFVFLLLIFSMSFRLAFLAEAVCWRRADLTTFL
jgi:hypothetical protein